MTLDSEALRVAKLLAKEPMREFLSTLEELLETTTGASHLLLEGVANQLAETYQREHAALTREADEFKQQQQSAQSQLTVLRITPEAIQSLLESSETIDELIVCNHCELISSGDNQAKLEAIGVDDPHGSCPNCLSGDLGTVARHYIKSGLSTIIKSPQNLVTPES